MGANLSSISYSLIERRANVGENLKIRIFEEDKVEICGSAGAWFDKLTMTRAAVVTLSVPKGEEEEERFVWSCFDKLSMTTTVHHDIE